MSTSLLTSTILPPLPEGLLAEAAAQWVDRVRDALDLWGLDRQHSPKIDEADAWTAFDLLVCHAGLARLDPPWHDPEGTALREQLQALLDAHGPQLATLVLALPLPGDWALLAEAWQSDDSLMLPEDERAAHCQLLLSSLDDLELLTCTLDALDPEAGLTFAERLAWTTGRVQDAPWDWLAASNWVRAQSAIMDPAPADDGLALTQHKFATLVAELERAWQGEASRPFGDALRPTQGQGATPESGVRASRPPRTPLSPPPANTRRSRPLAPRYHLPAPSAAYGDAFAPSPLAGGLSGPRMDWQPPADLGWHDLGLRLPRPAEAKEDAHLRLRIMSAEPLVGTAILFGVTSPLEATASGASASFVLRDLRAAWGDPNLESLVIVLADGRRVILELRE